MIISLEHRLSITSQCWLSGTTKSHFYESLSRKLSWGPTLITSDSLSLTIPATHQECPGRWWWGGQGLTLTFSTFYRETEELLIEFIAWSYWFIPIYSSKRQRSRKMILALNSSPLSYHSCFLATFFGCHSTELLWITFFLSLNNNKKQSFFFPSKKKNSS